MFEEETGVKSVGFISKRFHDHCSHLHCQSNFHSNSNSLKTHIFSIKQITTILENESVHINLHFPFKVTNFLKIKPKKSIQIQSVLLRPI